MSQDDERELAEKIVGQFTLPPDIHHVEISSGRDSTGGPALWIVLWAGPDFRFSMEKSKVLNQAAEEVQEKLLAEPFPSFPYVTLGEAA